MRKYLFAALAGAALLWLTSPLARAEVKPFALFGDGMVVQRDAPIIIWGTCDPGEKVEVEFTFKFDDNKEEKRAGGTTLTKDGTWKMELAKVGAKDVKDLAKVEGTLTINGKTSRVHLGAVRLCSGQSH